MQCASSLLFPSSLWPKLTTGQAESVSLLVRGTVSLWVHSMSQARGHSSNQPLSHWAHSASQACPLSSNQPGASGASSSQNQPQDQRGKSDAWQAAEAKCELAPQITLGKSQLLRQSSLPSSCLPFLTSAWLFTQYNLLTSLETIWVRVRHGTTLIPSPGDTQLPSFSGNDLASVHSPSGCLQPLCVSHFISIPPRDLEHPDPSWCWAALPTLVGQGAGTVTLLPIS